MMKPAQVNDLLEALDALTKPVRRKVMQPDLEAPSGVKTTTVILPPLLEQMKAAITASMGGSTSGASDPSARNLLDTDALFRTLKINSMVGDWARKVGAEVTKGDALATLRAWYVKYAAQQAPEHRDDFHTRTMKSWRSMIESKLDPPRIWDLPDHCPVCGAHTWWSPSTHEEYPRPLVIEYHPGADAVQKARAMCRACEQVWGVRELAWELEQAELRHAASDTDVTAG